MHTLGWVVPEHMLGHAATESPTAAATVSQLSSAVTHSRARRLRLWRQPWRVRSICFLERVRFAEPCSWSVRLRRRVVHKRDLLKPSAVISCASTSTSTTITTTSYANLHDHGQRRWRRRRARSQLR